jgi:exopolysaccharide biosynthesis polyprenyl glycosylphosphotransferase
MPHADIHEVKRLNVAAVSRGLMALDLLGMGVLAALLASGAGPHTVLRVASSILAALALWLLAARLTALPRQTRIGQLGPMVLAALTSCLLAVPPVLLLPALWGAAPGHDFVLWPALFVMFVLLSRAVWWTISRRLLAGGFCLQRVMIVAASAAKARMVAADLDRRTAGRLRGVAAIAMADMFDVIAMARLDRLIAIAGIDQLVLIEPRGMDQADPLARARLVQRAAAVTVLTETGALRWRGSAASGVPAMDQPMAPLNPAQDLAKRAVDIVIATLGLALAAPVLLTIGLFIKCDSRGPVLFRQDRVGHDGSVFGILKFRTMFHDETGLGAEQTARHDPRVTRVGALLRKSSFDELPQLVNVLRGDMSIVGPRPHAVGMTIAGQQLDVLMGNYATRYRMKPGITGWAQVNGCRGELATARALRKRVSLDCHYIDNWSFALDMSIILRTAGLVIRDPHAF